MLVFVYGTLRKDDCRAGVLSDYKCTNPEAYLDDFQMLHLGGFPGIVPGPGRVRGEVYEVDEACLKALDGIEGYRKDDPDHSLYIRETVNVFNPDGGNIGEVFTYVFNRDTECQNVRIIPSGDWFEGRAPRSLGTSS